MYRLEILFRLAEAWCAAATASGKSIALGCVIAPCTHVVERSITRTVTLVVIVCHELTSPSTTGNGMPLVDPFEPRVRTAPFSTAFAPMLQRGRYGVNTLDTWRKSSMRISFFPVVRVDFADMPGSYRLFSPARCTQRPDNEILGEFSA